MKYTLLEITQEILNAMDSDEVNDIDDTIESQQVANVIRNTYNNMISNRDWPHLRKLIKLDSSLDITKPTHLKIPEKMKEMVFFNYDKRKTESDFLQMKEVKYKYPDEFLRYTSTRNPTNDNAIIITDFSGTSIIIYNDKAPQFWTSFDDTYIVCDAYNAAVDDTLKSSKTQCLAYTDPVWVHRSDAVPDLPSEAFSALIEESKSVAFINIKQSANQKAEQESTRQQRWLSRKAWATHGGVRYPNFGRQGKK